VSLTWQGGIPAPSILRKDIQAILPNNRHILPRSMSGSDVAEWVESRWLHAT
jgi:hypothetical protein